MAQAKPKLSPDEAQEYSASLGKAATGNYELMDFAIHTLRVPESLGMTTGEWVESIGGYVRLSIEQRLDTVRSLVADGKTTEQISNIVGVSIHTVLRDKALIQASREAETAAIGAGETSREDLSPEERREQIIDMIEAGKKNAEIAHAFGITPGRVGNIRSEWNKEQEQAATTSPPHPTRAAPTGTPRKPSKKEREDLAMTQLDGYLARIEGHVLGFAAWWRQEGQKNLASQLAWVDETVSHTEEKVQMILRSVRGVNSDADAALTEWLAEEGRESA